MRSINVLLIGLSTLLSTASVLAASSAADAPGSLSLTPGLLDLFRTEMRELSLGTQAIASALPSGDWQRIVTTSRRMKASYVLEKKLTPAQEEELAALPEPFKALDANFHLRADRLAEAATKRDYEAVAFHYSRLLETCVACHAAFAHARFPAFDAPSSAQHR